MNKTRDQCRTRDCHTDVPWCDTYVCITLDHSCTGPGPDGKILDGPFEAKTTRPFPFVFNLKGDLDLKMPVCESCKEKNYSRNYCRRQKNHRRLAWNTVHVVTSLKQGVLPEQSAGRASLVSTSSNKRRKNNSVESFIRNSDADIFTPMRKSAYPRNDAMADTYGCNHRADYDEIGKDVNNSGFSYEVEEEGDEQEQLKIVEAAKLDNIPRSRTFLVTVSSHLNRVEWVDIDPGIVAQVQRGSYEHTYDGCVTGVSDNCNLGPAGNSNMAASMEQFVCNRGSGELDVGSEGDDGGSVGNLSAARGVHIIGNTRSKQGAPEVKLMNNLDPVPFGGSHKTSNMPRYVEIGNPQSGMERRRMEDQMPKLGAQHARGSTEIEDTNTSAPVCFVDLNNTSNVPRYDIENSGPQSGEESRRIDGQITRLGARGGAVVEPPNTMVPVCFGGSNDVGMNIIDMHGSRSTAGTSPQLGMEPLMMAGQMPRLGAQNSRDAAEVEPVNTTGFSDHPNHGPGMNLTETNLPRITANSRHQSGIEPRMMNGRMPQLEAQDMISHANLMREMEVRRHMSQMNQLIEHQIQVQSTYGSASLSSQPVVDWRAPFSMDARGTGYASFQDAMQNELEMRRLWEMSRAQLASDRNRRLMAEMRFSPMARQWEFTPQITRISRMAMTDGREVEERSNMMRMPSVASDASGSGLDENGNIVSGVSSGRDITANADLGQATTPCMGENPMIGLGRNLDYSRDNERGDEWS